MTEVVGAQLHLEAIGGLTPRDRHDAGVVDEQVEALGVGLPPQPGELIDRGEVGQVEAAYLQGSLRSAGADLLRGGLTLAGVADGQGHLRPMGREGQRRLESQPRIGPGHDGPAARLRGHVGRGPLVAHGVSEAARAPGRQPGPDA